MCTGARQALLDAIAAKKGDDEVIAALRKLAEENPTPSPAKSPTIFGEWKLLWASSNAEAGASCNMKTLDGQHSLATKRQALQDTENMHCNLKETGIQELMTETGWVLCAQVSRVLKLPIPAKSTQLLGKEFVGDEGRGANLIDIGKGTVVVRTFSQSCTRGYPTQRNSVAHWHCTLCSG